MRPSPSEQDRQWVQSIAIAIGAVLLAALAREAMFHIDALRSLAQRSPFSLMYPAVIFTALRRGGRAGLLATVLAVCAEALRPNDLGLFRVQPGDPSRLLLFAGVCLLLVFMCERVHRARHVAEAALAARAESERRIVNTFESITDSFYSLDRDWRFTYINHSSETYFRMPREQVLGKVIWEVFPMFVGTEVEACYRRAMREQKAQHCETFCPLTRTWVEGHVHPSEEGLSVYYRDVTERRLVQEALQQSEARYRRLVETANEGIWVIDADSKTTYVNRAMAEMLGYTPEEMLGRPVLDFVDPDSADQAKVRMDRLRQGIAERYDSHSRRKDGSDLYTHVSTNPILDDAGKYQGTLAMVSDTTARRAAEAERNDLLLREQRARAEAETANRRKDQFLAVLSHELRTPLTPVIGRLALMKREPGLSESVQSGLEMIRRNVELEARLIDDVLDVTRIARGQMRLRPEEVDAHEQIRAAVSIYDTEIAAHKLTVELDLGAGHSVVKADRTRLQQIFWNLVSNAVKYTPEGGHITVRSTDAPGGTLRVQVIDDGIGIEPEVMRRIFNPFEQGEQTLARRYGGLGLGLSISRTLVQMQGGTLAAQSAGKGKGSTFTVELPALPVSAAAQTPAAPPAAPPPAELVPVEPPAPSPSAAVRRILLVEDNADTLRVIAHVLKLSGYEVNTASSVSAALAAAAQPFDLLISDIGLPDGTGWELMRELRQRRPVRGIAISGFAMDEDVRRSRDVGFVEHLCKPISPDELEGAIRRAGALTVAGAH